MQKVFFIGIIFSFYILKVYNLINIMKKLAIVLDSFSGLNLDDINKYSDIYFLSLQIEVDDLSFDEGIDVPNDEIIQKIRTGKTTRTSLPSLSLIQDLVNKLSKEYENVIFLPIAKHMSGTHDTLLVSTKNYKNMFVINNHFVGKLFLDVAEKSLLMMENGSSIQEIISFVEDINNKTIGFIVPDDLSALINSGRLKGIKKHIISSGNFSIIIKVFDKLTVSGISRSKNSAIVKILAKLNKFCEENAVKDGYVYNVVYSYGTEILHLVEHKMKDNNLKINHKLLSSLSVLIHTGYGAIYVGVFPKLK